MKRIENIFFPLCYFPKAVTPVYVIMLQWIVNIVPTHSVRYLISFFITFPLIRLVELVLLT